MTLDKPASHSQLRHKKGLARSFFKKFTPPTRLALLALLAGGYNAPVNAKATMVMTSEGPIPMYTGNPNTTPPQGAIPESLQEVNNFMLKADCELNNLGIHTGNNNACDIAYPLPQGPNIPSSPPPYQGEPNTWQDGIYQGGDPNAQSGPTNTASPHSAPNLGTRNELIPPDINQPPYYLKTIKEIEEMAKDYLTVRNHKGEIELINRHTGEKVGDIIFNPDGSVYLIHMNKYVQPERSGAGSVLVYLASKRLGGPLIVKDWTILDENYSPAARPFWESLEREGLVQIIRQR